MGKDMGKDKNTGSDVNKGTDIESSMNTATVTSNNINTDTAGNKSPKTYDTAYNKVDIRITLIMVITVLGIAMLGRGGWVAAVRKNALN